MRDKNQLRNLQKAKFELCSAGQAFEGLSEKHTGGEKYRSWSSFLVAWNRAFSLAIKAAGYGAAKSIADEMKNAKKKDQTIQFIFQSRDSDEHVDFVAKWKEPRVDILNQKRRPTPFGMNLPPNASIIMANNIVGYEDGTFERLPNLDIETKGGVLSTGSTENEQVAYTSAELALHDVTNRSGTYHPPFSDKTSSEQIQAIAHEGIAFLEVKIGLIEEKLEAD